MKVRVHPGDRKGVGHFRLIWPAQAVKRQGVDVEVGWGLPILRSVNLRTMRPVVAPDPALEADVLVFQRLSSWETVQLIPLLQARGHAVVVDVDDRLDAVDPRNAAHSTERAPATARACALADLVTVSTPALARKYGAHGRVAVLPNCVPARLLELPRSCDGRTVGWGGWAGTHPGDLEVTRGGVQQALERAGARFLQVGPAVGIRRALDLAAEPDSTGGLSLDEYHDALGAIDVGICPLADTAFNRAKSWLKPLEMAARGVAVVMSPRPEYARLADEGIGLLAADRSRAWRGRISELISDPALRRQLAARSRDAIAARHTYEGEGWRWAQAWEDALLSHRARHGTRAAA